MRSASIARTAILSNPSVSARSPSTERLLIFWPRYLRIKGHGNVRTFATGQARKIPQEKKTYSTAIQLPIPLSGVHDVGSTIQDEDQAGHAPAQTTVGDSRYQDPKEYLEDYGIGLPEATVQQWQADLEAIPPQYALHKWRAWLDEVIRQDPQKVQVMDSFLGEEKASRTWFAQQEYTGRISPWKAAYLRICAQFDDLLDDDMRKPEYLGDIRASEWSRPFLEADADSQRSMWLNMDGNLSSAIWGHVMLYILCHHPDRALEILDNSIFSVRRQERSAVVLVFCFVARYMETLKGSPRQELFGKLMQYLEGPLQPSNIVKTRKFDRAITILRREGGQQGHQKLYELLTRRRFPLRSWSHLHFAYGLAHSGNIALALDALQASVDTASDVDEDSNNINRAASRSVCNVVLRKLVKERDGYRIALQVVSHLLEKNAVLSLPLTNALMLCAVESHDNATCLQLYQTAVEGGLQCDSYTYEFALRSVRSKGTAEQVQAIVREALTYRGSGRMFVCNAVLRCLGQYYTSKSRLTAFPKLLEVYRRNFAMEPLVELGIVAGNDQHGTPDASIELLEPDPATIHVMLYYFLESINGQEQRKWQLWRNVRHLMRRKPLFAQCGSNPHFYNTFIEHFGRDRAYVNRCFSVLKAMLQPSVTTGPDDNFNPNLLFMAPAAPDSITMSILISSVLRHRQWEAADMLLSLMKERGISMTKVTYQSLLTSYNRREDSERAIAAVKGMQAAGFDIDGRTISEMRRIKDREGLMQALDGSNDWAQRLGSNTQAPLPAGDAEKELAHGVELLSGQHNDHLEPSTPSESSVQTPKEREGLWSSLLGTRKTLPPKADAAGFDGFLSPMYYVSDAEGKLQYGHELPGETIPGGPDTPQALLNDSANMHRRPTPAADALQGRDGGLSPDFIALEQIEEAAFDAQLRSMDKWDLDLPMDANFSDLESSAADLMRKSSAGVSPESLDRHPDGVSGAVGRPKTDEDDNNHDDWASPSPILERI